MLGKIPPYLPENDIRPYQVVSTLLYLLFFLVVGYTALSFIFPYSRYDFDFNNPDANKNTLFEPHLDDFSSVRNGKVPPLRTLSLYAYNPHILEAGGVTLRLSKGAITNLNDTEIIVKRGWAATFFPRGDELDIPKDAIVEYQGNFYQQQNETLLPFVSQKAAESWGPKEAITSLSPDAFQARTIISEELLGFRPGTLLAYADGVFFVTEEATIRPFGSAEILLRAGYSFDHVIPASGEDVGIYKRGKIILPGELHPGGTIFYDTDSKKTFLFQGKKMHPLATAYADFLAASNDLVHFSSQALTQQTSCLLHKKILRNTYACEFDLLSLGSVGYDYQISFTAHSDEVDIQRFQAGLQSSRKNENARATARSLTNRVLERLGLY